MASVLAQSIYLYNNQGANFAIQHNVKYCILWLVKGSKSQFSTVVCVEHNTKDNM